jgi:hypothetical protein
MGSHRHLPLIEPLDIQPSILRFIFAVARTKNPRSSTALMNLVCLYFFHSSCTAQMGEARQVASSPPGPEVISLQATMGKISARRLSLSTIEFLPCKMAS